MRKLSLFLLLLLCTFLLSCHSGSKTEPTPIPTVPNATAKAPTAAPQEHSFFDPEDFFSQTVKGLSIEEFTNKFAGFRKETDEYGNTFLIKQIDALDENTTLSISILFVENKLQQIGYRYQYATVEQFESVVLARRSEWIDTMDSSTLVDYVNLENAVDLDLHSLNTGFVSKFPNMRDGFFYRLENANQPLAFLQFDSVPSSHLHFITILYDLTK